ncbi:MAG: zinc-ribbon domain-containing protein [Anaerolineae bacterium]|nr:zinc-ribbon domain-containing protein [Phycisphaerae bacterium]
MSQLIQCPNCSQSYTITAEQAPQYAGQTIQCTRCGKPFVVNLAGAAPVGAPASAAPSARGGFAPPPAPAGYQMQYQSPMNAAKATKLAIASLIFGCIGVIVPVVGVVAVTLGIIALLKTRNPQVGGRGIAIAGISVGGAGFVISACLMSILLPSLGRARETANRVKCASNLRQIGQAMLLYANDNRGAYPHTPDLLLLTQDITPEVFICPTGNHTPVSSDLVQQALKTPNTPLLTPGKTSYVYLGKGKTNNVSADTVVVYELMTDHDGDGGNFLFGDGHVEWESRATADAMIAEIEAGNNPPRFQVIRNAGQKSRGK